MKLIAITSERELTQEVQRITTILDGGVDYVHIRKPSYAIEQVRELITAIPMEYHHRLKLHDHFSLTSEFELGGVHLNGRNPEPPTSDYSGRISRTAHTAEDIANATDYKYEYITLSPIFDSISKVGYKSNFTDSELRAIITNAEGTELIALGGVNNLNIGKVKELGFSGAAILGYLFSEMELSELKNRIKTITT